MAVGNGPSVASSGPSQSQSQSNMARHDSFRARLPNTSRPPSLHVDEFLRLENSAKQQQANNSNNANLVSIDTSGNCDPSGNHGSEAVANESQPADTSANTSVDMPNSDEAANKFMSLSGRDG